MRTVNDCISSFISLLSTEYEIILGRRGIAVKLIIIFDKKDCFHLMGLQYLADRPELRRDRGKIFDEIQKGIIKQEQIESSDFYYKIQDRNLFLFLSNKKDDYYFCRSFFPEEKMDYTKKQASWTLLYKKKKNLSDGTEMVLYDRLKKS